MEERKTGTLEAFSMNKGVVKIDGTWYRFPPEMRKNVSELERDERVEFIHDGRDLHAIKPYADVPGEAKQETGESAGDRDIAIAKSVALKQACELAEYAQLTNTEQVLKLADIFATWLITGEVESCKFVKPGKEAPAETAKAGGGNAPPAGSMYVEDATANTRSG